MAKIFRKSKIYFSCLIKQFKTIYQVNLKKI